VGLSKIFVRTTCTNKLLSAHANHMDEYTKITCCRPGQEWRAITHAHLIDKWRLKLHYFYLACRRSQCAIAIRNLTNLKVAFSFLRVPGYRLQSNSHLSTQRFNIDAIIIIKENCLVQYFMIYVHNQ